MKDREKTLTALERFVRVVEELRSDHGCPWDRAQTHGSIRMELIEEAYEAAEAMRQFEKTGAYDNLKEELGDVLLHIVMHGVIAEEEGIFTLEDIAEGITAKMIHRHPHVFNAKEWEKQENKKTWEELKAEEKGHEETQRPLRQLPKSLPALLKAAKVLKRVDNHYQSKTQKDFSLQQISYLASQLLKEVDNSQREKIMISMLYHMVNIAWQEGINLEKGLMDQIDMVIEGYEPERAEKSMEDK